MLGDFYRGFKREVGCYSGLGVFRKLGQFSVLVTRIGCWRGV